ncbi:hypothetical protein [Bdellovibrio sp. HCB2-146]|uniref:hypothetical protein n=1 Tax=Bdellovibrio sp. HCB2-146 TaxID=3394362 RepID=UPI0039BC785B
MNPLLEDFQFTKEAQSYLKEIEKNLKIDFTPPSGLYYSFEDFEKITNMAYEKLATKLAASSGPIEFSVVRDAWTEILTDYHRSGHWGFKGQNQKPPAVLTEQQQIRREMWPYIWVVIQSMIILKTIVYYFGIKSSDDPSLENKIYLGLALGTSAFTLIFFAWRKSRK